LPHLDLLLGFIGVALLAAAAGAGVAIISLRADHDSPARRLREEADRALTEERMSELAETVERRRKRVEAANARAAQREAAAQQQQQEQGDLSDGAAIAQLSVHDQLAWASKRARHRPFGGGVQ
jgi:hypothetical protein